MGQIISRPWSDKIDKVLDLIVFKAPGCVKHPEKRQASRNYGISLQVYAHYLGFRPSFAQFERMTQHEAKSVYWRMLVKPIGLDAIDSPFFVYTVALFAHRFGVKAALRIMRSVTRWPQPKGYGNKEAFKISPQEQAYTNVTYYDDQRYMLLDDIECFLSEWVTQSPIKRMPTYLNMRHFIKDTGETFKVDIPPHRLDVELLKRQKRPTKPTH